MVSQKSMLPRGPKSNFPAKKNASLPYSTYCFLAKEASIFNTGQTELGMFTKLSGSHPHVQDRTRPSQSELEVKLSPIVKTAKRDQHDIPGY